MKWISILIVLVGLLGMSFVEGSTGRGLRSRPVRQVNYFNRGSIYFPPSGSTGRVGIARPSQIGVARPSSIGVASPYGK